MRERMRGIRQNRTGVEYVYSVSATDAEARDRVRLRHLRRLLSSGCVVATVHLYDNRVLPIPNLKAACGVKDSE